MHVRTMQLIDYWVGVPLCGFMTCVRKVLDCITPHSAVEEPKKIVFIELSEMGSAILAYSMLEQAKRKFPGVETYFLIFKKNRESCEILDSIPAERILEIDDSNFLAFCFSTLRVLGRMRALGIDTAIDLELFSRATALITYLSGATRRVGFHRATNEGLYRGSLLTDEIPYNPHQHISLNFLTLLGALEADKKQVPLVKKNPRGELIPLPTFSPKPEDVEGLNALLREHAPAISPGTPLIIVNPDPGDALPIRGWPLNRFSEVTKELLAQYPNAIAVVIGLKRSKEYALAMQAAVGESRCIDLTGKTPNLRSVLTLFLRSHLLLTNDSGPAHLAALSNLRSIVLFGPETPALYGPLSPRAISLFAEFSCSPCLSALNHRYTKCNDNLCLQAISTETVLGHAQRLLDEALREGA